MAMAANFPSQPTPFIGRESELTEIGNLLANPACRLLTLVGPGGIGKTRLAVEAAQQVTLPGEAYFVPLQPLTTPDFIVNAIADSLKFSFLGKRDLKSQFLHYLREKHLLLVLDNFEHLLDGADLLPEILVTAPGVKLLVTSRERLHLREEWLLDVRGLPFPSAEASSALEDYTAMQFFAQSARRAGYLVQEADTPAIRRICQVVEGIPLAIELAAVWTRVMPCAEIAREVERSLDILATTTRNVPEKHRSMRAAFERSWDLLTGEEQAVFRKLAVFRGGFTREGAEQVAGATLPILASLVDKSLVQVTGRGRYDLHELLRQYAADKLLDANEDDATVHRHSVYFLQLAEAADTHAFGREQVAWFDRLEAEIDNLRAVLNRLIEEEDGLRLVAALGWFFNERTYWGEGLAWLEYILAANPHAPDSLRAKALTFAGSLAFQAGISQRTQMYCEQALALARETNDRWNTAWALCWLGLVWLEANQKDEAAAILDECLALFRALDDRMGITHTLIRCSWVARGQGDVHHERLLVEEAGILAHEAGDAVCEGWVHLAFAMLPVFRRIISSRPGVTSSTACLIFVMRAFRMGTSAPSSGWLMLSW